jgi:hypothetical protein
MIEFKKNIFNDTYKVKFFNSTSEHKTIMGYLIKYESGYWYCNKAQALRSSELKEIALKLDELNNEAKI